MVVGRASGWPTGLGFRCIARVQRGPVPAAAHGRPDAAADTHGDTDIHGNTDIDAEFDTHCDTDFHGEPDAYGDEHAPAHRNANVDAAAHGCCGSDPE